MSDKHPTKDEILEQRAVLRDQIAETNRKRKKVKQELYPVLLASAKSVEDAKLLCQIIAAGIRQDFNNQMRKQQVKELNLISKLNEAEERFPFFKTVLELFQDEPIISALEMIEGLPKNIESYVTEEMAARPLQDLKVEFMEDIPELPTA